MALFSRKQAISRTNADYTQTNAESKKEEEKSLRGSAFSQRSSAALLKQTWITEKAGAMSGDRKYMFIVQNHANKSEVKKAVQSAYGVKVQDVNMIVRKGKAKRLGRSTGRTPDYKKAIVTLKEGQKIEALTP